MRNSILDLIYFHYVNYTKNIRKKKRRDEECVVIVADYMTPRIQKIGYGLKKKGMRVILFIYGSYMQKLVGKKQLRYFDEWHYFKSTKKLFVLCMCFKPLAYHVFVGAQVPDWAVFLIRNKGDIGKIVYDPYDIYRGMYEEENEKTVKNEKFCLENADGIVCRSFQTEYLKKTYAYKFKGKRLLFFDYCWNEEMPEKRRKSADEELCFVYAGRLLPQKGDSLLCEIEWKGVLQWVLSARAKNAKFIIVPSHSINPTEYYAHIRLANRDSHFVLEECMDIRDLLFYEKEMDYGTDSLELYADQNRTAGERVRYGATNKYFDYIDAGIPIITGRPTELFARYLKRYGVTVECILEDLPQKMDWLKAKRNDYAKSLQKAKQVFSIENQIGRLLEFYRRG